jgi:predicted Zn-dependent protease with MMP-like domain
MGAFKLKRIWEQYQVEHPRRAVRQAVHRYTQGAENELMKEVLEVLGLEPPIIIYVKNLKGDLGRYARGSAKSRDTDRRPVILLDSQAIIAASKEYDVDLVTTVESTLWHELGHAFLNYYGRWATEDEEGATELFAHTIWETRNVEAAMEYLWQAIAPFRRVGSKEIVHERKERDRRRKAREGRKQ